MQPGERFTQTDSAGLLIALRVFDDAGALATEFGGDEILGVSTDEFGIETVCVYRLNLPSAPNAQGSPAGPS